MPKLTDAMRWLAGDDDDNSTRPVRRSGQRRPGGTTTITVAKPFCSPARDIITGALQPYGVVIHDIREEPLKISLLDFARKMKVEARTLENIRYGPAAFAFVPLAVHAHITVNKAAAGWAEYLLLRTGKLYVPGKYVNRRNQEWAERYGGQMPPAWGEKPWLERCCSDGIQSLQDAKLAIKQASKPKVPPPKRKGWRPW